MSSADLRARLEGWAKTEVAHANRLSETARRARSPLVRAVLTAIAVDSEKHYQLLMIAEELLTKSELSVDEFEGTLNDIREHIATEEDAIKFFESQLRDPAVASNLQLTFVLKLLLRDEKFHHIVLHDLYQALVRGRIIGQGEEWEELYRELDRYL
ncbi:hypothetical protein ASAC_0702 [Acidilobus saccharovorans 345-15]|uniref:Rubrerythrin diiron-binding domain-containing protein n=1 Tax=Acidilobus saccharovorans (strain DSM 16705 / JCM 18335 / VKM B-2471 / 345-15) TaxID=666510 RepID=D9Q1C0_ACIS3|nr:hypothetical protein [Acidilobus saccharovorans]ADL19108.1 hypothetical protein ASAC_0702 [Acidilobus saccharovorans 345-15]